MQAQRLKCGESHSQSEVAKGTLKSVVDMQIVTMETNLNAIQVLAQMIPSDTKLKVSLEKVRNTRRRNKKLKMGC